MIESGDWVYEMFVALGYGQTRSVGLFASRAGALDFARRKGYAINTLTIEKRKVR